MKVTPEGKVKVLDFGLAKAFEGDAANDDPSNSPTLSMAATMHGVILGTAAYMSPEQARGKAVDKRTDIWAFGCVLYELLSGQAGIRGRRRNGNSGCGGEERSRTGTDCRKLRRRHPDAAAALLAKRQDVCAFETLAMLGSRFKRLSRPKRRLQLPLFQPNVAGGRRSCWVWRFWLRLRRWTCGLESEADSATPSPRPESRFTITLPPGQQLAGLDNGPAVALSPDGTHLAYVATQGGTQQIYLRPMDSLEARPIPGTEGAGNPFFSPDGQWVGFFADGKLKKVSVSGGAALTLGDAAIPRGASWGSQDMIAFAPADVSLSSKCRTREAPRSR